MARILITGGAGFIGSRLSRKLCESGHEVTVFDNLHPQIHGHIPSINSMHPSINFIRGMVQNRQEIASALDACSPEIVYHLAAETGTGQSYSELSRYCEVNILSTAILLEEIRVRSKDLRRIILASSRAVYGEGAYITEKGIIINPEPRKLDDMSAGEFRIKNLSGGLIEPIPTIETLNPRPSSVYASTKLMQEYLLMQATEGTKVEPVVLRMQNVYGPGQSLNNPYTGVLSIFCSKILNGEKLNIFEDGLIVRDFIFIEDVVSAFVATANLELKISSEPINIGSGTGTTILLAAQTLMGYLGNKENNDIKITGQYRVGDIRHAIADIRRARNSLQWSPSVDFHDGLKMLADWSYANTSNVD